MQKYKWETSLPNFCKVIKKLRYDKDEKVFYLLNYSVKIYEGNSYFACKKSSS